MGDRDWSNLSKDLLVLAFQRLEIPDLLRSAGVSRSWCSATDEIRRLRLPSPPQAPFLLIYGKGKGESAASSITTGEFYSLSEDKTYTVPLPYPPIRLRICIGSSHGWLFTADNKSELCLLNPMTGSQIDLPRVATFDHIKPVFGRRGKIKKYTVFTLDSFSTERPYNERPGLLRHFIYRKGVLSSSPSEGDNYTVMLIHHPYQRLSFARAGDSKWTTLPRKRFFAYVDCIHFRSCFYTLTARGTVEVWDLNGPSPVSRVVVPEPVAEMDRLSFWDFHFKYLVQTPCGDLLQVWRQKEYLEIEDGAFSGLLDTVTVAVTVNVRVFRMDLDGGRYVEVHSLGDYAVFLGSNHGVCISPTKEIPRIRKNCVYLADDDWEMTYGFMDARCDVCVYNLENRTIEPICPANPRINWPPPIWVTPSFT